MILHSIAPGTYACDGIVRSGTESAQRIVDLFHDEVWEGLLREKKLLESRTVPC